MSKSKTPERPRKGGSYTRQPDGALTLVQRTRPRGKPAPESAPAGTGEAGTQDKSAGTSGKSGKEGSK